MELGDILLAQELVTVEDLAKAGDYQRENGGRLGDALVATGILGQDLMTTTLGNIPAAPNNIADTGIDPVFLLQLFIKGIFAENLELPSQFAQALCLPANVISQLVSEAFDRKMIESSGSVEAGVGAVQEMRYGLTKTGRDFAQEAMNQSQYFGPAPITLEMFCDRIRKQKVGGETVDRPTMEAAFSNIVIPDRLLTRLGPAVNSGTALLLYGPAGNGKTTIAEIIGRIFKAVIYIPHCFVAEGQIVKIFDPTVHEPIPPAGGAGPVRGLRRERFDKRFVACSRPLIITGGELSIEMLDLKFNELAKFYEAPLHVKALNGTFLIDDFGRQRASPSDILNRWIVPLNSRIDFMTFHTGKAIEIPFDELVIFSTNLHPNDLMDPAFQRRIAYKLETVEPPVDLFRCVFEGMAKSQGLELTDEVFGPVMKLIEDNEAPLAYFHPKFIIEQVMASCKFEAMEMQFTPDNVEDALLNLFVKAPESKMFGVARD